MECFNWSAVSAIGTILAALVGIIGIWLNIFDKKRKLDITIDNAFRDKIYICNNSVKTVRVIKMIGLISGCSFYAEHFDGLDEIVLHPSEMKTLTIDTKTVYNNFYASKMDAICNSNDPVELILQDNYRRKYRINTGIGIAFFKD